MVLYFAKKQNRPTILLIYPRSRHIQQAKLNHQLLNAFGHKINCMRVSRTNLLMKWLPDCAASSISLSIIPHRIRSSSLAVYLFLFAIYQISSKLCIYLCLLFDCNVSISYRLLYRFPSVIITIIKEQYVPCTAERMCMKWPIMDITRHIRRLQWNTWKIN